MITITRQPVVIETQKHIFIPASGFETATPSAHDLSTNNAWPALDTVHGSTYSMEALVDVPFSTGGLKAITAMFEDNGTGNIRMRCSVGHWNLAGTTISSSNSPALTSFTLSGFASTLAQVAYAIPSAAWSGDVAYVQGDFLEIELDRLGADVADTVVGAIPFLGILIDFK